MSEGPASLATIAVTPPALSADAVATAVQSQFGIAGELRPLISERDQNFRLSTNSGERFVVKVVSQADTLTLVEFQVAALEHLERQNMPGVPRVVQTKDGDCFGRIDAAQGERFFLRLVTWVDGEVRPAGPGSVEAAASLGSRIAELGRALAGFSHPGQDPVLLWDTRRVLELLPLMPYIDEPSARAAVETALADFERRTLTPLASLPQQLIHNDLNGGNVLYDGDDVCGIIDFGDMLRAPRIIDLTIAASYLRDPQHALRLIVPLVHAYNAVQAVTAAERDLFFDLLRARLCTTTIMLYWRLAERSDDDPYRHKTLSEEAGAVRFLQVLNALGKTRFDRELFSIRGRSG